MDLVITENDLLRYIVRGRVVVPEGAELTPAARELAVEKGLLPEEEPEACRLEEAEAANLEEDSPQLRRKVIDACRWLVDKGLVIGTWGNVSCRLAEGNYLITPTRVAYDEMEPEDLVVLAPDGSVVRGTRRSTSEREIHRGLMNRRRDVNAVVHTHSPYAMACCAAEGGIPPISEEMAQLLGGGIPQTERFIPSEEHENLGNEVCRCIGNSGAILIRNHGPVCVGRSLEEACVCAQVVEKAARMYLALRRPERINVLEDRYVRMGRRYYTDAYGKT